MLNVMHFIPFGLLLGTQGDWDTRTQGDGSLVSYDDSFHCGVYNEQKILKKQGALGFKKCKFFYPAVFIIPNEFVICHSSVFSRSIRTNDNNYTAESEVKQRMDGNFIPCVA
jgi:hypothetical protein